MKSGQLKTMPFDWSQVRFEMPAELPQKAKRPATHQRRKSKASGSRRFWTAEEDEVLRRLYPVTLTRDLALQMGCKTDSLYNRAGLLGIRKTAEWKASKEACKLRRNPEVGEPTRFKKGHTTWNKGLKHPPGWAPGRMRETQFKKGNLPWTWVPVGSKRYSKEGYLEIKFREREGRFRNWKGAHILLWEKNHGPVPPGHKVVFRDGDKAHIVLENLELISDVEMMRRNSMHNLPEELFKVIQLTGALKRRITNVKRSQGAGAGE